MTDLDPSALRLIGRINGEVSQEQVTSDLLYGVPEIIEFVNASSDTQSGRRRDDRKLRARPATFTTADVVDVEIAEIGNPDQPCQERVIASHQWSVVSYQSAYS